MPESSAASETQRVRDIWEKLAPRYDKDMKLVDKIFFAGGREWVCSQASGEVLEIGVGCDPLAYVKALGFEVERVEPLKWGIVERVAASKPS